MQKKIPMRQCVGCREMRQKKELVRVVKSPEGVISLDFRGKAPGRGAYLCPGFIDAHVHIESSMVIPDSFSRVIMPHGTTTIIADPHEIANVCGVAGERAIYKLSDDLPLRVLFMMPSCVPATPFENSGATITAEDMEQFMRKSRILGLG